MPSRGAKTFPIARDLWITEIGRERRRSQSRSRLRWARRMASRLLPAALETRRREAVRNLRGYAIDQIDDRGSKEGNHQLVVADQRISATGTTSGRAGYNIRLRPVHS